MSVDGGVAPLLMLAPAALEAAKSKEVHRTGTSLFKMAFAGPIAIVSIILLISALIAIGNGAYTMGTMIVFLLACAGFYSIHWLFSEPPQYAPPQPQYAPQQYAPQPRYRPAPRHMPNRGRSRSRSRSRGRLR